MTRALLFAFPILFQASLLFAAPEPSEVISVWPDLAPGETTKKTGDALPPRETDKPTITRVENITSPTLAIFPAPADKANGVGVLILPGGGFGKVVPDMEGSEAAAWLNGIGISAFVLSYRTTTGADEPITEKRWLRPVQDSQRAMRYLRQHASKLKLDPAKIGLLGFSAGGQAAAIHLTQEKALYDAIDEIDQANHRPDFSMLVYPWNVVDKNTGELMPEIVPSEKMPPGFIVHTDDDKSSSLGAALIYLGMKKHGVSGELHVYQSGGHGYGTRDRPDSVIGTWTDRGTEWLRLRDLAN
ncbi:alpha/beta hydrolase [Verrucomicrobiales bacterium]|nr:alpha/beta hydrolase [Verrucomicrobiales bacterium]